MSERSAEKAPLRILDPACGGRMWHFDKRNPDVTFADKRAVPRQVIPSNGQYFEVSPDVMCDFKSLPFEDGTFDVVTFDPPHVKNAGQGSFLALKYGVLITSWREELAEGFAECFRVLRDRGVLIFKWNEASVPVREVLALTPYRPLVGHTSGKHWKTHWVTFVKCPTPPGSTGAER